MFFDNIILFLNVLEQFAIRVTIFGVDIEDIIKNVNKNFFGGIDGLDYFNYSLVKNHNLVVIDPYVICKEGYAELDKKIGNSQLEFKKLNYPTNITRTLLEINLWLKSD